MSVGDKTHLNFINLIQLDNWSVQALLDSTFNYSNKFLLARIGDFLSKSREIVNIEDDNFYNRITIKINNKGVVLRDTEQGVNIGTKKQYLAKEGQFIVSKIDARNGAFGIIPSELDGAVVTNDFPLFDVNNKKINPQFLLLITTTKEFIKFAQSCSSGTTNRQRMDIEMFLNQKIPLPSIVDQDIIVNNYFKSLRQAQALRRESEDLENEIERYFLTALGVQAQVQKIKFSKLRFIEYKNLERWDGANESDLISAFPIEKIGKYISEISTGTTPPTNRREYFDGDVDFYTPSELGNKMYLSKSERKLTELAIQHKKARRFDKGTLLFVGIGSTVGKIGIISNDYATSNQQITGFKVNQNVLLNEFVYYYFSYFKHVTTKEQTRATLPIVNQDKILNIPIPILPLEDQQIIVNAITSFKHRSTDLRNLAEKKIFEAARQFETAIFN